MADNTKTMTDDSVVYFDVVSLYPSAMKRLYVVESIPYVLSSGMLSTDYLT